MSKWGGGMHRDIKSAFSIEVGEGGQLKYFSPEFSVPEIQDLLFCGMLVGLHWGWTSKDMHGVREGISLTYILYRKKPR